MTEPLPTLADIDGEMIRTLASRADAALEVEQRRALIAEHEAEIVNLWRVIAELGEATDAFLELRTRVSALAVAGG